jgi:ribonucleoside-diphosphate reductase beta chain
VVKSFSRQKGLLQNIDNVVQATMKEEQVHAQFGVWLTNLIRAERPDWFGRAFYADLRDTCVEAFSAEHAILDWVFADGNVPTVSRPALTEFLKDRINQGVTAVGGDPVFEVEAATLAELDWFNDELKAPIEVDFFHKHSTNYNTGAQPVTAAAMW